MIGAIDGMEDQFLAFLKSARGIAVIILFFGGSIFVHELGHFLAAKWRGLRVEKFSIGFGPRLFGWRGKGGTDYRISLLPLGGYVSIPELAEMEMIEGKTQMRPNYGDSDKKISYLDRIIVFAAGAFFNVLFAFALAVLLWGVKSSSSEGIDSNVIGYVAKTIETERGKSVTSPAMEAGLREGDRIVAIDGEETPTFDKIITALALGSARTEDGRALATITVERDGSTRDVQVFPCLAAQNPKSGDFMRVIGISPVSNFKIAPKIGMPAYEAGARYGDKWTAITTTKRDADNSEVKSTTPLYSLPQLSDILEENGDNPVEISYERNGVAGVIKVEPIVVAATSEVATLKFTESGQARTLTMIATPEDLEEDAEKAPRDTLRIFAGVPNDSDFAELLVPGSTVDGISFDGGAIKNVKTPKEFSELFGSESAGTFSLFLTKPDGGGANAILTNAVPGLVPEHKMPLLGVHLLSQERLVRKSPWSQFYNALSLTFRSIAVLFNPHSDIGISHLNGIFSIGDTYYEISADIRSVFALTLLININLAILNLLPIPVLDGGHILLATIRKLRRRPISQNTIGYVQTAFFLLFVFFMGYVLVRDFSRVRGSRELAAEAQIQNFAYAPEFLTQAKYPVATDPTAAEDFDEESAAGTASANE
ncbi:MAG: site-2 protease family protein [Opitutae bacterium]|nr:site-2 protease family protein [Opitutae bacterium]